MTEVGAYHEEVVVADYGFAMGSVRTTIDIDAFTEDVVVAELKPGYTLNGKLLRPASVKITKKKETND